MPTPQDRHLPSGNLLAVLAAAALLGLCDWARAQHDHGAAAGAAPPAAGAAWFSHWQLWAALIAIGAFLLFTLLHRAGLFRRVSPGLVGGVALLLVGYFATSYVVERYRQPGQMTLLEANIMDMAAMRAPAGTVPVATEVVTASRFASGVTYTGTVVALNDEDVYPRVPGTIVSMPVYPGDRVRAGQVLVRLDDREYTALERAAGYNRQGRVRSELTASRESEAAAAARVQAEAAAGQAQAEVQVAQREVAAAEATVSESRAAVTQAGHDLTAVRSEEAAAEQAQAAAQAEAQAAAAGVNVAEAEVESAAADLAYWQAEIERAKRLLDRGAVSLEEYQREEAAYAAAKSRVAQAQAAVRERDSAVQAAQARSRQAEAAIRNARARVAALEAAIAQAQAREERAIADRATAQARLQAAEAGYRSARAAVTERAAAERAALSRVSEAAADVGESTATLTAARTVRGYTEIRATRPGRVLQRAVSPGVLASPGMLLLRLAQVDRVRLQAYVTEKDLQWMRVGDPVEARHPRLPGGLLSARLTAIFPAADPATRTAIVEAQVTNPGEVLSPGDAVSLKITTHPREGVLTVPNAALVYRSVSGGGISSGQEATVWLAGTGAARPAEYTCPMHPEVKSDQPGVCPKCKMDLVLVPGTGGAGVSPEYVCPMCPEVRSDRPGTCPECKMDLVPAETPGTAAPGPAPHYTCPMHPEVQSQEPGICPKCKMDLVPSTAAGQAGVQQARRVVVTLGGTDGERTEVLSGLREGDVLIVRGHNNLREGDLVYPVPWTPQGPAELPPAAGAGPSAPSTPSGHEGRHGSAPGAPPWPRPRLAGLFPVGGWW